MMNCCRRSSPASRALAWCCFMPCLRRRPRTGRLRPVHHRASSVSSVGRSRWRRRLESADQNVGRKCRLPVDLALQASSASAGDQHRVVQEDRCSLLPRGCASAASGRRSSVRPAAISSTPSRLNSVKQRELGCRIGRRGHQLAHQSDGGGQARCSSSSATTAVIRLKAMRPGRTGAHWALRRA